MTTQEKVEKIRELNEKRERWSKFAETMDIMRDYENIRGRNYRSLSHYIRTLFGKDKYATQFELVRINAESELIQLNYDFAVKEIERLNQEILDL